VDAELPSLPIGRSGRLNAVGLTNATGSHALLVRHDEESRALITGEPVRGSRDRLIVVPFDEDVELRVDGDALAIWLAQGSVGRAGGSGGVPAWASAIGFLLVLLVLVFLLVGAITVFSWLFAALGWVR
jgi:hypothetical protein